MLSIADEYICVPLLTYAVSLQEMGYYVPTKFYIIWCSYENCCYLLYLVNSGLLRIYSSFLIIFSSSCFLSVLWLKLSKLSFLIVNSRNFTCHSLMLNIRIFVSIFYFAYIFSTCYSYHTSVERRFCFLSFLLHI